MKGAPPLKAGALKGVRVVDFTWFVVGPLAPRILAQFGAEVLKIERPDEFEVMRRWRFNPEEKIDPNRSGWFNNVNADK
ncbi:MAG: CoA transferase, partial [Chloroflexi bacterium]|nr:CoA transferase [Chloroflexota bacterium]